LFLENSEGAVTASDIAESANVEVLNPEHVICNISSGGSIRMELKIARGKGYVSAIDNKENLIFQLDGFLSIHFSLQFTELITL
jgi:DNA-directed RNA polymerase alpha subunit